MPFFRVLSITRNKHSLLLFSRYLKKNHIQKATYRTETDLDNQQPDKTFRNDDIFGVESSEGAICFEDSQTRLEKFQKPPRKPAGENFIRTTFGAIRRDQDNSKPGSVRRSKFEISPDKNEAIDRKMGYKVQKRSENNRNVATFKDFDADLENFPSENVPPEEFSGKTLKRNKEANFTDHLYFKNQHIYQNSEKQRKNHVVNEKEQSGTLCDKGLMKPKSTNQSSSQADLSEISYIDSVYFEGYSAEKDSSEQDQQNISSELDYIDSLYFDNPSGAKNASEKISQSVQEHESEKSSTNIPNSKISSSTHRTSLHSSTETIENVSGIDKTYFESDVGFDLLHNTSFHGPAEQKISEIDKQYFGGSDVGFDSLHNTSFHGPGDQIISEMDKQYFGSDVGSGSVTDHGLLYQDSTKRASREKELSREPCQLRDLSLNSHKHSRRAVDLVSNSGPNLSVPLKKPVVELGRIEPEVWEEIPKGKKVIAQNKDAESEGQKEPSTRKTAFDYVANLRKERGTNALPDGSLVTAGGLKQDSKGFRILTNQVPDLTKLTRDELITELKSRVLYSDDDVVILDKPYNLVMHEAKTTNLPTLESVLDGLSSVIDGGSSDSKLITVHRLDKTTTGCLLLARNEKAAMYLKALFAQRQVKKTYWIVTIRTPENAQGIIDIPITEGTVDSKARMVLHPNLPSDTLYKSRCRSGKQAVTKYSVISTSGNAALIEAEATTGVKHQIRVHFGFGLNCPILGDHKYSHLDKLAPQKLPSDILQRLHVRQSKVRYVPMHIHARSIVIPNYYENRDLFAYAPLPGHFRKNLETLKFRKKK